MLVMNYGGDTDGDGICNDGDNSGYVNDNPCGPGDSIGCDDNCVNFANPGQEDTDGDLIGDGCDLCPNDANNDQDHDGICEGEGFLSPRTGDHDNCTTIANPDQTDTDDDHYGDACDNCIEETNTDADIPPDHIADDCTPASVTKINPTTVQICFTNTGETAKMLYPDCCQMTFVGYDAQSVPRYTTLDRYCGPYIVQDDSQVPVVSDQSPPLGDMVIVPTDKEVCVECDLNEVFAPYVASESVSASAALQSASTGIQTASTGLKIASAEIETVRVSFDPEIQDPDIVNGICTTPDGTGCNFDTWKDVMYFPPINVTAPPTPGRLVVDIQPGTYPNDIVLNRKGKQPVGIMGTQNFSVSSIDPANLELAGAPVLYQEKRWNNGVNCGLKRGWC